MGLRDLTRVFWLVSCNISATTEDVFADAGNIKMDRRVGLVHDFVRTMS